MLYAFESQVVIVVSAGQYSSNLKEYNLNFYFRCLTLG